MIQIFGTTRCKITRAAQRFFSERRIQVQFVDLKVKGLSAGELASVARALGGVYALYDQAKDTTVRMVAPSETKLTELLIGNPSYLKTPIVRDGPRAFVGSADDGWRTLADAQKSAR